MKSSLLGLVAVSMPRLIHARQIDALPNEATDLPQRYPSIGDEIVAEVVGVSHFDLDRLKTLVGHRPELARATWDWAFGDWETALGAASHVGRRDIAEFLMGHGARPDIFTYAMLGSYDAVKAMIEATPGIQHIGGPHGISLLQHARNGLEADGLTLQQKGNGEKLVAYLEGLGDADQHSPDLAMTAAEKEKYVGDYTYGDGPNDGLSVKLNKRKLLSFGKRGAFGGALYQKTPNVFVYNGTTSVEVSFEVVADKVLSLTVHEPDLTLKALKV